MTESRRIGSHVARLGLMLVLYMAVTVASLNLTRSAAGLPMFHAQLLITAFYLTISAIFGFSQAISEEKEDGTLGLMRLADVSPLSIILGKMMGRLIDAGLLIAIQFPFTIVSITLGGVSWAQVVAAYAALAAYLWLLATLGIAASVIQRTGAKSAQATVVLLIAYIVPPYLVYAGWIHWPDMLGAYEFISLPLRLSAVTESSFGASPWCSPVVFGGVVGLILLLVAWWQFDRRTLEFEPAGRWQKAPSATQGDQFSPQPVLAMQSPGALSQPRRAWSHPVIWRDFIFLTGGVRWMVFRTVGHFLILIAMGIVHDSFGHMFAWAGLMGGLFSVVDGTWLASRLFRDEIRDRTWSTLVQTPQTIPQLALGKCCGWAIGLSPSILLPYLWLFIAGIVHEYASFEMNLELFIGSITVGMAVFAYLHLLVLMSLYFGWKATPLTLTLTFASAWIYVRTTFHSNTSLEGRCGLYIATSILMVMTMVGLQVLIVRRLRILAESA